MNKGIVNETFNVGTGTETSINDLLTLMMKVFGKQQLRIEHKPQIANDVPKRCPDVSKIMSLGWKPKFTLEEGLKEMIK
jgi:UDP-glucose 4-epimerase